MEKERTSASDEARPIKPVTEWENAASKDLALLNEKLFHEHIEKTQELRDRQAAYRESLPTDPPEAIRAALKLMHPGSEQYPDGIEEALHLSFALEALVRVGDVDKEGWNRPAALYVAERVAFAMYRAVGQLDQIADILGNPGRIEQERKTDELVSARHQVTSA